MVQLADPRSYDVDLLIVGGGILGLCVAWLAEHDGLHVFVARQSDITVPHADTLRNQAWLQSGLRYLGTSDNPDAFGRRMQAAGRDLHDKLLLPHPTGHGVLRAKDEDDAKDFEERGRRRGLPVRRLSDQDAANELGALFEPGSPYLATPELPFREAEVLKELRAQLATSPNVSIGEGEIELTSTAGGIASTLAGNPIRAKCTVLAAGAGTIPLLKSVGHQAPLVKQTPLLVTPSPPDFRAVLFHDRVHGLSFVKHETPTGPRLVIGAGLDAEIEHVRPSDREISDQDEAILWAKMPPCIAAFNELGARITAGMEPYWPNTLDVAPWIETLSNGLIVALPGRATLAMDAAEHVLSKVRTQLQSANHLSLARPLPIGTAWTGAIHMHYEDYYSHLHDV